MKARKRKTSSRGKYDRSLTAAARQSDQRTKLLDAATSVIAAVGFGETTVEAIVERAGMSRRTYYEHFTDVRDVLAQIYERASSISLAMVTSSARAHTAPLEALRAGLAAYFLAVSTYPEVARVMFQEYRQGGRDFEARYQRDSARYAELLLELLGAVHTAGAITKKPTEATVFAIAKGIEGLAVRAIAKQEQHALPALLPELVELTLAPFR
ncbi:MAG: TetR/AcrR family transcriptional regulator [Deltaproteobacteria bacterium]|nr:TetR/AcrR family transcriptional regulator [Deltaproteobacteria bacterium]